MLRATALLPSYMMKRENSANSDPIKQEWEKQDWKIVLKKNFNRKP
jgi:hypothetical protein